MQQLSRDALTRFRDGPRPSRSDMAYEAIHQAITYGQIQPGAWLRQEALADSLNISQVPVREALARLVAEGLAVHHPYKGVRVRPLSVAELRDVYEARAVLEGFALELAAELITPEELDMMRELLPATAMHGSAYCAEEAWQASRDFHLIAVRASGRRNLTRLVEQILDLTNPYGILRESGEQKRLEDAVGKMESHAQILESLKAGDGERARETLSSYLDKTLHILLGLVTGSASPS